MADVTGIAFLFGAKTLRELLADFRWRWSSDERDAEQRRRHEDDVHQIEMRRKVLEIEREFGEGASPMRELEAGERLARPELPPPDPAPPGGA